MPALGGLVSIHRLGIAVPGRSAHPRARRSLAIGAVRQDTKLVAIKGGKLRDLCEQDHDLGYRMSIGLIDDSVERI